MSDKDEIRRDVSGFYARSINENTGCGGPAIPSLSATLQGRIWNAKFTGKKPV